MIIYNGFFYLVVYFWYIEMICIIYVEVWNVVWILLLCSLIDIEMNFVNKWEWSLNFMVSYCSLYGKIKVFRNVYLKMIVVKLKNMILNNDVKEFFNFGNYKYVFRGKNNELYICCFY